MKICVQSILFCILTAWSLVTANVVNLYAPANDEDTYQISAIFVINISQELIQAYQNSGVSIANAFGARCESLVVQNQPALEFASYFTTFVANQLADNTHMTFNVVMDLIFQITPEQAIAAANTIAAAFNIPFINQDPALRFVGNWSEGNSSVNKLTPLDFKPSLCPKQFNLNTWNKLRNNDKPQLSSNCYSCCCTNCAQMCYQASNC